MTKIPKTWQRILRYEICYISTKNLTSINKKKKWPRHENYDKGIYKFMRVLKHKNCGIGMKKVTTYKNLIRVH